MEITVLVPTTLAQLAVNNPVIDKIICIPYSNNDFKSKIKKLFSSIFLIAKIFFKKFDTAIILDSSRVSILISKLARIPNIIGGDLHSFGYDFKNPISKYYTNIVKLQKNQDFLHASIRFQTIIKSYFNIYNTYKPILPNSSQYKTKILNLIRNKNKTIVALCIKGSKNTSNIKTRSFFAKEILNFRYFFYNLHI